jgi:predicted nucleic acid-binding protein
VSTGLADTSVFIARESGRRLDEGALPDRILVSVITIGELRAGVLSATDVVTRERRLATLTEAQTLTPVPIDEPVAHAWARLRVLFRETGERMPVNDSWIAATALALDIPIVTQDDDYAAPAGLEVVHV